MKYIILLTVLLTATMVTRAQQLEQWTQFSLNEYTINPAVSGADDYFHAHVMFRNQWVGIVDAPRTYYLSVQGPIWGDRMGLGGAVFNDVVGPISKAGLQLSYAYHAKLSDQLKWSFALSGSIFQWAANGAEMRLENGSDIAINNGNMSAWIPDFGFATRVSTEKFHAGIYIPQITNSQVQLFSDYPQTQNELDRHFYLNLGYKTDVGENFALDANFFSRYVRSIFMQELQARVIVKDMVWLGASARMPIQEELLAAVGIMAGYQFKNNMMIGYSYDIDMGRMGAASRGSHEVLLGIRFTRNNPKPVLPPAE